MISDDEQEARLELLEEDAALATEAAREHNEDGARRDGRAELGRLRREVPVERGLGVLGRVPLGGVRRLGDRLLLAALAVEAVLARHLGILGPGELIHAPADLLVLRLPHGSRT